MGGTSTDVCLIAGGVPGTGALARDRRLPGAPAGARHPHHRRRRRFDRARSTPGGALRVGPRSAGADPGPACYGRGGDEPTVTDADLVLGHIAAGQPAARARDPRRRSRARRARPCGRERRRRRRRRRCRDGAGGAQGHRRTGRRPSGARAGRVRRRGPDACVRARGPGRDLDRDRAGASGRALCGWPSRRTRATRRRALGRGGTRTPISRSPTVVAAARAGRRTGDVEVVTAVDCRYPGQSHELTVPSVADFHAEHERRNGYARPDAPVEVVAVRASARVASPIHIEDLPTTPRSVVVGPALVSEADCTTWVPEGWRGDPGNDGALVLTKT